MCKLTVHDFFLQNNTHIYSFISMSKNMTHSRNKQFTNVNAVFEVSQNKFFIFEIIDENVILGLILVHYDSFDTPFVC